MLIRALLDQGSEASFVTENVVQVLGLPRHRMYVPLSGIGASSLGVVRAATQVTVQSTRDPDFRLEIDALILPRLTNTVPAKEVVNVDLGPNADLPLADPNFHRPASVALILGADCYAQVLRPKMRHLLDGNPVQYVIQCDSSEAVKEYRLKTVTYGTSSAPFLAIRALKQLAQDEGARFPLAAVCLLDHSFVDDIFSGSSRFELSKWAATHEDLIPVNHRTSPATDPYKLIEPTEYVHTLGLVENIHIILYSIQFPCEGNTTIHTARDTRMYTCVSPHPITWESRRASATLLLTYRQTENDPRLV